MKFLCDVHISYRVVITLSNLVFTTVHVNDILDGSSTKDSEICKFVDDNNYTLITKDSDFVNTFLATRTPKKLIKINLGNIPNDRLISMFLENIERIATLDNNESFLLQVDKNDLHLTVI